MHTRGDSLVANLAAPLFQSPPLHSGNKSTSRPAGNTDGQRVDSVAFQSSDPEATAGKSWQASITTGATVRFAKVVVTNLDEAPVANLRVIATLGG